MLKRFWKVLALNKNQNEIELDGKKIAIGKKEKRMARISQSIMEFIPLFAMFVFVNNPHLIEIENAGLIMSFLVVTVVICGVFVAGCVLAYLVWRIGVHKIL